MRKKEYALDFDGAPLIATFSDLAERANGSVTISYKDTVLLVTATMAHQPRPGSDFLPLTVDYEERFYALGKILGNKYSRREGKPSDEAILNARVIDRTIRPLFDKHIRNEIQIVVTTLSIGEGHLDTLAIIGTSLALGVSDIPWNGPVGAARITKKSENSEESGFELIACGKDGHINMIECAGNEASEESVLSALMEASDKIEAFQTFQKQIISEIGKQKKEVPKASVPESVKKLFEERILPDLNASVFSGVSGDAKINELGERWHELAKEALSEKELVFVTDLYEEAVNELVHEKALTEGKRPDGRGMDDIRPLSAAVGDIAPIIHGSGTFYRGETHILSILTLGGPDDALYSEGGNANDAKRYIHHYNFPPFSVGDTGKIGVINRRMIGHGALAEKALLPVLPSRKDFPYTIRVVSEAFSSNGSTSMGSVCGSTLALMDAGVPIKRPVAGIASGLMMKDSEHYKILTDIQGPEDHHGDMDFKVAGTRQGVTAIQMDVKVSGIPFNILKEAFEKAKRARLTILDVIETTIAAPRTELSQHAPRIATVRIAPEHIGLLIGPGGKTIKAVRERSGVDTLNVGEDGAVFIMGKVGTIERCIALLEEVGIKTA